MKRLIVGLGNPGEEYAGTRHNAGFLLIDRLAERLGTAVDQYRSEALTGEASHRGASVVLAKPTTYVNRSGDAVWRLLQGEGRKPRDALVAVDDLNLDIGQIRLRPGGGSGGHNGLGSIAQALGTEDYPRLRIGIGSGYARGEQVEYVLAPFSAQQQPAVENALERACEAALAFVDDGIEEAMNRFN
jgi:PTH1 family peptidyl-tRNA hydrolase